MESGFKKNLYDFIETFIKRILLIICILTSFIFISIIYTFHLSSKTYVYNAKLYLNINANGYNVDRQVISQLKYEVTSLFIEFANSKTEIKKIEDIHGLKNFGLKFTFEQKTNNPIVIITYTSDKELNTTKELETYLNSLITDFKNIYPDIDIKTIENFNLSLIKGPKVQRNVLVSIIGALFVSFFIIIILELFDNKVSKIEEIAEILKTKNVVYIPKR